MIALVTSNGTSCVNDMYFPPNIQSTSRGKAKLQKSSNAAKTKYVISAIVKRRTKRSSVAHRANVGATNPPRTLATSAKTIDKRVSAPTSATLSVEPKTEMIQMV